MHPLTVLLVGVWWWHGWGMPAWMSGWGWAAWSINSLRVFLCLCAWVVRNGELRHMEEWADANRIMSSVDGHRRLSFALNRLFVALSCHTANFSRWLHFFKWLHSFFFKEAILWQYNGCLADGCNTEILSEYVCCVPSSLILLYTQCYIAHPRGPNSRGALSTSSKLGCM